MPVVDYYRKQDRVVEVRTSCSLRASYPLADVDCFSTGGLAAGCCKGHRRHSQGYGPDFRQARTSCMRRIEVEYLSFEVNFYRALDCLISIVCSWISLFDRECGSTSETRIPCRVGQLRRLAGYNRTPPPHELLQTFSFCDIARTSGVKGCCAQVACPDSLAVARLRSYLSSTLLTEACKGRKHRVTRSSSTTSETASL